MPLFQITFSWILLFLSYLLLAKILCASLSWATSPTTKGMTSAPVKDFPTWWISPTTVFLELLEYVYSSIAFKVHLEYFYNLICEVVSCFLLFYELALGNPLREKHFFNKGRCHRGPENQKKLLMPCGTSSLRYVQCTAVVLIQSCYFMGLILSSAWVAA